MVTHDLVLFQGGSSVAILLSSCVGDFICDVCFVPHLSFFWYLGKVVLHASSISEYLACCFFVVVVFLLLFFFCRLWIFLNQLFQKYLSGIPSECQTVWIQIRSGLNWVQTICKGLISVLVWRLQIELNLGEECRS